MDYEKLKYDAALQISAYQWQKSLDTLNNSEKADIHYLEIFASVYTQICKIPNAEISELFEMEL